MNILNVVVKYVTTESLQIFNYQQGIDPFKPFIFSTESQIPF